MSLRARLPTAGGDADTSARSEAFTSHIAMKRKCDEVNMVLDIVPESAE